MEIISGPSSFELVNTHTQELFIQSEQDGLFFGFEFLQYFLKSSGFENSTVTAYMQDGDCVFKGQTCVGINLKDENIKKEDLLSAVSYFSGAYTLISCFTEKNFDFSISASLTQGFSFSEWEEKAILKAGALIKKCPENICLHPENAVEALKKGKNKSF